MIQANWAIPGAMSYPGFDCTSVAGTDTRSPPWLGMRANQSYDATAHISNAVLAVTTLRPSVPWFWAEHTKLLQGSGAFYNVGIPSKESLSVIKLNKRRYRTSVRSLSCRRQNEQWFRVTWKRRTEKRCKLLICWWTRPGSTGDLLVANEGKNLIRSRRGPELCL